MRTESVLPIDQLVDRVLEAPPRAGSTRIVAIDGRGGAGKSTFSRVLAAALEAEIVETDDFASWDNPLEWWPRLIEQLLDPLAQDRVARYQQYDWVNRRLGGWSEVSPADNLVLEGVSSSRLAFRPYLSFAIWVETPREVCLERGLIRDGEPMRDQWAIWMREEDEHIAAERPLDHADLVIAGAPTTTYDFKDQVVLLVNSSRS